MKKSILHSGKTVESAIKEALATIGKNKDEVEIEVLQEDSKGIFGLFNKREALVKINYETDIDESLESLHKEILSQSFDSLNKEIEEENKEEIDSNFKDYDKFPEKSEEDYKEYDEEIFEDETFKDFETESKEDYDTNEKDDLENLKPQDETEESNEDLIKDFEGEFSFDKSIEKSIDEESSKENSVTIKDEKEQSLEENSLKKEVLKDGEQLNEVEIFYKSRDFLQKVFEYMHLDAKIYGNLEKNHIKFDVRVDYKDTGIAIGKNKKTLDAIEYIVRCAFSERKSPVITIDINNYKKRRDKKLEAFADNVAKRALKTKKRQNLKFMNAYDRRIVHTTVQKYDKLRSYSEGVSPGRYVVIEYIKDIN